MIKNIILLFVVLIPFLALADTDHSPYQMPGIHVLPITDKQSNKQYELLVKLPENYDEDKSKKYPVIYFTDAVWHIELLSAATAYIMEDVILVGISWQKDIPKELKQKYGAHFSRFGDYSFKKRTNPKHPKVKFGQADNHLSFIRDDVFKIIEKNYRTEPSNRSYLGFSAGGLFGTYALLTQPNTFKNYILGSPSIWSSANELFAQASARLNSAQPEINIFISYGELEKKLSPHVEDFISQLKGKNYQAISSIKQIVIDSSGHSDSFPMLGVQSVKWLSNLQEKGEK